MDMTAYMLGFEIGQRIVELSGDITCTDDGSENVTIAITAEEEGEET